MKIIKKYVGILLAVVLISSLFSGCGGNSNENAESSQNDTSNTDNTTSNDSQNTTDESDQATEQVEIRFAWWGDTLRHEVYNAVCDEFEAENPDVKVIREPASWGDYWDKLATQTAGMSAPDVMGMHPQFVSDYAGRNSLADLEPYMENGVIDTSNIPDTIVQDGRVGGTMVMVSQGVTFTNMIINDDIMKEVGVEYPDLDWTWSEYAEIGKEFADKAQEKGLDYIFSDDFSSYSNSFRYMVRSDGQDLYTADGEIGFDEQITTKWFQYWKDLRDYGGVIPDAATVTEINSLPLEQKPFTLGKIAVAGFPVNQLHLYQAQMGDANLVPHRNPTGDGGERGEYLEGAHIAVSAFIDDKNKDAAARFVNFFVNSEDSLKHLKMEQGVPANEVLAEYIKPLLNESQQKAIRYVSETMPVAGTGVYAPVGASAVEAAYKDAFARVQFGVQTPEESAEQFMQEALAALEDAKN